MATISFIRAAKLIELVQSANKGGDMYVRVVSGNRLALGNDPVNPTFAIDLSKEAVIPFGNAEAPIPQEPPPHSVGARASRRSGDYWIELLGKRADVGSLRELLAEGLRSIETAQPGTLEKLTHIKPKSKRIAHDKKMLFESEHLSDEYADQLMTGWWYGTNNSAQETDTWLERACGCAGLKWGKDLRTSLSVSRQ